MSVVCLSLCQNVQQQFFISAMLIGTIDLYHFIRLSLTLTMPGGHKVSASQNLLAFIFSHTFHLIRMEFDIVMKQFKCNILRPHLSKIYWSKGKKLLFYRLHQ